MDRLIYNCLDSLFNSSLATEVKDFIGNIMDALISIFQNKSVNTYFTIFTAVAASLLIIFFMLDLAQNATRDMITLERLVLAFIKLIIGVVVLMYLPEILDAIFTFIRLMYEKAATISAKDINKNLGIKFYGQSTFPKYDEELCEVAGGNVIKAIATYIDTFLISAVIFLSSWAAKFAAYFFAIGNAINLIAQTIFAPVAIAQCFDDGSRSVAVRYLKKFAATGLTFAIMLVILYASTVLQSYLISTIVKDLGIKNLEGKAILEFLSNLTIPLMMLVINLSAVGGLMKANQLSQDLVGA